MDKDFILLVMLLIALELFWFFVGFYWKKISTLFDNMVYNLIDNFNDWRKRK